MQMNPPLRSPADRQAMLEALRDGTADYLATDHAPHTLAEKENGVSGQPHLDTYGPFVTWLLVEQGFTPRAHRRHLLRQPGGVRQPLHQREVRPAAARLRRLADRAGPAPADDGSAGGLADRVRLEPV